MAVKDRPIGVTVIAVLEILLGLGNLFIGYTIITAYETMAGIAGIGIFGDLLDAIGFLIGAILMLIAILHFFIAYGFLNEEGWAWLPAMFLSIAGIFFGIVLTPIGVIPLIGNAIIIFYLNTHDVIESFRNPPP